MKFYIAGSWRDGAAEREIHNPYDDTVVDTVPEASPNDVEEALASAVTGAESMASLLGYERYQVLRKAADLLRDRLEEMAVTLSSEEGKTLQESRAEVLRSCETLELSGEEAKRIAGELLPLDGGSGTRGKLGFTLRVPCGVVVTIAPFNYPLNLVCHKVGPALAAGNAVVLKPAADTPLVALKLVEILLEAGLPPHAINCITGDGKTVGGALCADRRVRKVSFTGSRRVGEEIIKAAGIKRVTMELGSNCPVVVLADADLDKVAAGIATSGYVNSGQVCLSAQRILVDDRVHDDLLEALRDRVESIVPGNQLAEGTTMGPMIREADAQRVVDCISEAVRGGARLVTGGEREGCLIKPAVLAEATPDMRVCRDELFGPAVAVMRAADAEEAIRLANDTQYGLSASVFTQDIDAAIRFARQVHSGMIHINWGTLWRTDPMPFGGLKNSGIGREGPKYAIEEMTETKTVVIHGSPDA